MFGLLRKFGGLVVIAAFLFAAGCGSATQTVPTVDAAQIYTQAALTVQAELTQVMTPFPATATITPFPEITNTAVIPTADLNAGTPFPTLPGPQSAITLTIQPTINLVQPTTNLPGSAAADKAQWLSNTPTDNATVEAGAKFDIVWQIKNTGQTTWKVTYQYRVLSSTIICEKRSYNLKTEVKPGEVGSFIVDAVAPAKEGTYNTWWKLTNDLGQNFADMTLVIVVVKPGDTPVPTKTETTTP
jgi:predicted secreted protein